jgi:hypothetical protein
MTRALEALRVLLGVVLVVTALRYFMPFLLPFVPEASWDDPLAFRLMTAFDKSGLLAVAKFIHLVAGAMLLANRAVPFALAALMPVNVCGLFIALLIEGDPLVGGLAVLTVALNGLLMLAYLPAYRGVLDGGQLADGESPEPGGTYESLYVNPLSGAPPSAYLGAALVLLAALAFYWFVVPGLNSTTGVAVLAIPAVALAAGWVRTLTRKA